jgi:hypothetical protein
MANMLKKGEIVFKVIKPEGGHTMMSANFNFNLNHPEQKIGEMWLTNILTAQPFETVYASRLGKKAYSRSGLILKDYKPVFVSTIEYEAYQEKYK